MARVVAWSFLIVDRRASVYAAGSLGRGELVYGLSDFDMVVVSAGAAERLRRHVERLERLVPGPPRTVLEIATCTEDELRRTLAATVLTGEGARLLADPGWRIVAELQERPGVGRPVSAWRRLGGPERRPAPPPEGRDRRRLEAWLEQQHWWRHAFRACLRPHDPAAPYLCLKLMAEPLRAWLWLELGEAPRTRREVLARASRELPEEEEAIGAAVELARTIHRLPEPPLAEALGLLVRTTERVAAALEADAAAAGAVDVRLTAVPSGVVPLADWRALVAPRLFDEVLVPLAGDPADPQTLSETARRWEPGRLPALRSGRIVVLPSAEPYVEGMLRAVACAATDPVSTALLAGAETAAFPELPGLSARYVAGRAVAEHAAWLLAPGPPPRRYLATPDPAPERARLLTARRAARFAASLDRGDPELQVMAADPSSPALDELRREVLALPAYRAIAAWREDGAGRATSSASLRR